MPMRGFYPGVCQSAVSRRFLDLHNFVKQKIKFVGSVLRNPLMTYLRSDSNLI